MAYSRIEKPGRKLGPCINENCGHRDCAELRHMAGQTCPICQNKIGYARTFSLVPDETKVIAHHFCILEKYANPEKSHA
jgi:hypothetical protein